jgi:hypothetical protein
MSVKEKYFDSSDKNEYPLTCKQLHIGDTITIRCKCEDSYADIQKYHNTLLKSYPHSQIVKTYRYRFKSEEESVQEPVIKTAETNTSSDIIKDTNTSSDVEVVTYIEEEKDIKPPLNNLHVIDDFLYSSLHVNRSSKDISGGFDYIKEVRLIAKHSEDVGQDIKDSLRVKIFPQHFTKFNLQKRYFNTVQDHYNYKLDSDKYKIFIQKYTLLVQTYYMLKIREYTKKYIKILQKSLSLLQDTIELEFNIKSIFKITDEIKNKKLTLLEQNQQISQNIDEINQLIPTYTPKEIEVAIQNYDIISSQEIKDFLNSYDLNDLFEKYLLSKDDSYRLALAKEKIKISKSTQEINFDHLEIGYDLTGDGESAYTIRAGLNIPISGSNKVDTQLKRLDFYTLEHEISNEKRVLKSKSKRLKKEILDIIKYNNDMSKIMQQDSFYTTYSQSDEVDLLFLIEVNKKQLEYKEKLSISQKKLHLKFIEFIDLLYRYDSDMDLSILNKMRR